MLPPAEFDALATRALAAIPLRFRRRMRNVVVVVERRGVVSGENPNQTPGIAWVVVVVVVAVVADVAVDRRDGGSVRVTWMPRTSVEFGRSSRSFQTPAATRVASTMTRSPLRSRSSGL